MMGFVKETIKKFLIALLFLTCSCTTKNWYKPYGYSLFSQMPKGGTPGFELGWTHGCESGLGTQFGGAIYQTFYTWKRDPDITSSNPNVNVIRNRYKKELKNVNWNSPEDIKRNFRDYNAIFWGSHAFCRHAVLGILQTAGMTPSLPGEARYDPSAHSPANVWKIDGKGDTRWATGGMW